MRCIIVGPHRRYVRNLRKRKTDTVHYILDLSWLRKEVQSVVKINDKNWMNLMEIGSILGCHQMPERSFFIKGYQFPVCARCTGVIISALLATVVYTKKKIPKTVCVSLSGVMLLDWGLQYLNIKESTNKRRFLTGLVGGFGYTTLHLYFYTYVYKKIRFILSNKNHTTFV